MRWDVAVGALLEDVAADAQLVELEGFQVIRRGELTAAVTPSLAWSVFSDRIDESTNPIGVQFDIFARGIDQALLIERRLRARHRDVPQTIGGVLMLVQFDDARDHEDPEAGVVHRSVDFHLEPVRERAP